MSKSTLSDPARDRLRGAHRSGPEEAHETGKSGSINPRRRFFVVTAGCLLAIVLIGFSPSFFLKFLFEDPGQLVRTAELSRGSAADNGLGVPGLPLHVIAHGVLATAWMVLFFVQTLLITRGRPTWHKKLGVAGVFIGAGVALSGTTAVCLSLPRLIALANPPDLSAFIAEHLPALSGDIGSFMAFSILVGAAVYFRRRPDTHKRLMLVASMILIPPALARIWAFSGVRNAMELWFPVTENGLAILIIGGDWLTRRRPPWALIGGFVLWIALYGGMTLLGGTDTVLTWAFEPMM